MTHSLEILDFSCGYNGQATIRDINILLKPGSFTGIIGPNGSGKTTLFRGITGILQARNGRVLINNKNLKKISNRERAKTVAIVNQLIDPLDITVLDYVLLGRLPHQKPFVFFNSPEEIELAMHYLKVTGIEHLKDKMLNTLSGGEQQMASIARALNQEPQILLLDEPIAHLDVSHQIQLMDLVYKLNKEKNLTVLIILHDLNIAGEYCDHLVLMNEGKIYTQGSPDEVLTYQNIEEVYHTVVISLKNPLSGKPVVFPVSKQVLERTIDN